MQIIHGKRGTLKKNNKRRRQSTLDGSFFKGVSTARKLLKFKSDARDAALTGSTGSRARTLAPEVQHLRTIQLEQQQRVAAEAIGLSSLSLHRVHGSSTSRALVSGQFSDGNTTCSVTLTPEVEVSSSTSSSSSSSLFCSDMTLTWNHGVYVHKVAADVMKDLVLGCVYGWGAEPTVEIEMEAVDKSNIDEVHAMQAANDDLENVLTRFSDVELNKLKLEALVQLAEEFNIRLGRHKMEQHITRSLVMKRNTLQKQLEAQKAALEVAHTVANNAEEMARIKYGTTNALDCIVALLEKQEKIDNEDSQSKKSVDIVCKDVVDEMIKQVMHVSAGLNINDLEKLGDLFTRKRIKWSNNDKNKIIAIALKFQTNELTVAEMLNRLKKDGHKILPSPGSVSKWLTSYRKYGFFSEDCVTVAKQKSKAISTGKLTSELFEKLVLGRVLILLSLGFKTKRQTYANVGLAIQATDEFKLVSKQHVHHKRNAAVQKLTFSNGWVDKFKSRNNLVRRVGDMQKLGKLPSLEDVSDNQEKCQIEYERLRCLPALIATAGKLFFLLNVSLSTVLLHNCTNFFMSSCVCLRVLSSWCGVCVCVFLQSSKMKP